MLSLLYSVPLTPQQATVDPRLHWRLLEFLLPPGAHKILFVPSKSLFPQSYGSSNQIPLASKVKFLGGSQSLCQIPRLGNLLWVLELSSQCENFFGIIILQFLGHLLGISMMHLVTASSKRAYATWFMTQVSAAARAPVHVAAHC